MPLYTFECECGEQFEKLYSPRVMKQREAEGAVCTKCGKVAKRILSKIGAPQFIGSGFYATDYKGK